MARTKERMTEERNRAIMAEYDKVLADLREKYGDVAEEISMKKKYTMVGEKFYLSYRTVALIISKMTKQHNAG